MWKTLNGKTISVANKNSTILPFSAMVSLNTCTLFLGFIETERYTLRRKHEIFCRNIWQIHYEWGFGTVLGVIPWAFIQPTNCWGISASTSLASNSLFQKLPWPTNFLSSTNWTMSREAVLPNALSFFVSPSSS